MAKKEIKEEGFKLLKQRPLSAKEIEDKLLAKGFYPTRLLICAKILPVMGG